jgi:membrane protein DedA with SNARE-associated domain
MDFSTLQTWGYLAIALFSFGGSMLIVATAAIFAYLGHIDLTSALIVAAVSNFLGDTFLFYLGKYQKKEINKYLEKHKRKLAITRLIMRKYGTLAIFIQKFIYGVKTLIPIVMALSNYDFKRFTIFNLFASFIFVFTIGTVSYFFSGYIIEIFEYLKDRPYIAPLILIVVATVIWQYLKNIENRGR